LRFQVVRYECYNGYWQLRIRSLSERERTLLAMDAWLDEGIAQLIEKLEELGEHENTVYAFLIDNGWANGCVSKGWAHDKGLRTPMIVTWPKGLEGGARYSDLVSPVDLYATFLDLAQVPIPEHCQGRSLRPRLEGAPFEQRAALYGALYPLEATRLPTDPARDAYALWARDERWKYILTLRDVHAGAGDGDEREDIKVHLAPDFVRRRGEVELYDLGDDPYERRNLAAEPGQAARLTRFREEVLAWWRATGGGPLDLP